MPPEDETPEDETPEDEPEYPPCEGCDAGPASVDELAPFLAPDLVASMPADLRPALAACARCLSRTGETIDRVHTEEALAAFGGFVAPLPRFLIAAAHGARPDLAASDHLVYEVGALLVHPAEVLRQRIANLEQLKAPDVVIDPTRAKLRARENELVRLEWERVHAWPPPEAVSGGSRAHAALAKVLARHALPALLDLASHADLLRAIEKAADTRRLDAEGWALRERLTSLERSALPIRMLDELGCTDLRDNQDTLLDDTYFTLKAHGLPGAESVYRVWLEAALALTAAIRLR